MSFNYVHQSPKDVNFWEQFRQTARTDLHPVTFILDSGLTPEYIEEGDVRVWADFADWDQNIATSDTHGTHVLKVFRTVAGNLPVAFGKVFSDSGSLTPGSLRAALSWADKYSGNYFLGALNLSLGTTVAFNQETKLQEMGISNHLDSLNRKNIPVVTAVGNEGIVGVSYPAAHPDVIGVGSLDKQGAIAQWSNRHDRMDLVEILALGEFDLGTGEEILGTSFSSPLVCAYIALAQAAIYKTHGALNVPVRTLSKGLLLSSELLWTSNNEVFPVLQGGRFLDWVQLNLL